MLAGKLGIEQVADKLKDRQLLMRVDFNVPLSEGKVTDKTRIEAAIPTIQYALSKGVKTVILISHCGRPSGRVESKYSLKPVAAELEKCMVDRGVRNAKVIFVNDCVGENVENTIKDYLSKSSSGSDNTKYLFLLENLRFHPEEEGKGVDEKGNKVVPTEEQVETFKKQLTRLSDGVFVNDAFGTAHRAHASMVGVSVPLRVAGLLMKKEIDYFISALNEPKRPFLSILGGAKVKDKIQLIKNLLSKVDRMIICGGMAFTFKKVLEGMEIGNSLFDEEGAKIVPEIMREAKERGVQVLLPVDFVCADKFANDANKQTREDKQGIPQGWMGLDIGPNSVKLASEWISSSGTLVWNGPPGVFEFANFASGSMALAAAAAAATGDPKRKLVSIVGGGDTAALVEKAGFAAAVSHVSTGGGAALELLEGKVLPGVKALTDA